ncbi:MAG: hypothetical protein Ct9H300mP28_01640 [Pseudomonadota bacterium]|nr:MAG: hypothetical protein Ct9H300mP28_01640 [Pseudomonadota bacterium]
MKNCIRILISFSRFQADDRAAIIGTDSAREKFFQMPYLNPALLKKPEIKMNLIFFHSMRKKKRNHDAVAQRRIQYACD